MITNSSHHFLSPEGALSGKQVVDSVKTLSQLKGVFLDETTRALMDQSKIIYKVQALLPVGQGTEGGLFYGTTCIEPGTVNEEYFMTQGHFHQISNRAEYYWGIQGEGVLILMARDRSFRGEWMRPGSIHYIPSHTAHRVANIGERQLIFNACWPADAGHDYEEIVKNGFSCRLFNQQGAPSLIKM